jgi:RNA-directed DNA polymerase
MGFRWRVALSGGNYNNNANAGVAYLDANNDSANANTNIGSRLYFFKIVFVSNLASWQKNKSIKAVLVGKLKIWQSKSTLMKREGKLFEYICSEENILKAFQQSRRGKATYTMVQKINENPEIYLEEIKQMLIQKTFINSPYRTFIVSENGKKREISSLPYYPDRIIQHAIIQITEPVFRKVYIEDTYASMKGRGIHAGVKRIKKALYDIENTTYCLKLDIRKFYQSVDHDILKKLLSKKIKDNNVLELLSVIIDSADGLPIGNYSSQHLANFYLAYFDHYVKEVLHIKYYFRYCDDMVLLHSDKNYLHDCREKIGKYLQENLKLELKQNYQVFPVNARGIDFLGYVFFQTHVLIRKRIKIKMLRTMRRNKSNLKESMASYSGWLKHANAYNLAKKYQLI